MKFPRIINKLDALKNLKFTLSKPLFFNKKTPVDTYQSSQNMVGNQHLIALNYLNDYNVNLGLDNTITTNVFIIVKSNERVCIKRNRVSKECSQINYNEKKI
ncbi:hypothetical protein [Aquimarina agarivorans]|uniref:hypothetical protein n=1 Tax=Aquimarina agarivorans TaxID=980584 RepID=UPI000248E866|nr:hypothetical protein [Aquimarina agarivorans]